MSPEIKGKIRLWNHREATAAEQRIVDEVEAERLQQNEALHADPPQVYKEEWAALAFAFDLTTEEFSAEFDRDKTRFRAIFKIATAQHQKILSWEEATDIHEQQKIGQGTLQDKIGKAYNSRFPDYPKPAKIFESHHKRRKGKTKGQIIRRAEGYLRWKEASDALNVEPGTPLDEFPNPFDD